MPTPRPRLYLLTPRSFDPARLATALDAALSAGDVACLRLRLGDGGETAARQAIKALKPICHAHDVAFLIEDAFALAAAEGLDGVHLSQPGADFRAAREAVGADGVIGAAGGVSRHQGLIAGERGADYVSFGPLSADPGLQTGPLAELELFDWWQSMIELPVVAEGGVTPDVAAELVGMADFIALDPSIWDGDAAAAVAAIDQAIKAAEQA